MQGTGYLSCGACIGSGGAEGGGRCPQCAGTGKVRGRLLHIEAAFCLRPEVCSGLPIIFDNPPPRLPACTQVMCTACFCTGKQLATEHDPRIDPFNIDI